MAEEKKKPTLDDLYRLNPEMRDAARLHDILMKDAKRPVVMTVEEFEKFIPIFQNHPSKEEIDALPPQESRRWDAHVQKLTMEYTSRVNLFKEVYVVEHIGDTVPVLIIPPTFMPMVSTRPDQTSEAAWAQYRQQGGSDVPRNTQRAEAGVMEALKQAQNSKENLDRIRATRKHTIARFNDWKRRKQAAMEGRPITADAVPKVVDKQLGSTSYDQSYAASDTEDDFL